MKFTKERMKKYGKQIEINWYQYFVLYFVLIAQITSSRTLYFHHTNYREWHNEQFADCTLIHQELNRHRSKCQSKNTVVFVVTAVIANDNAVFVYKTAMTGQIGR